MNILLSFFIVVFLVLVAIIGVTVAPVEVLFGVVLPYVAIFTFPVGVVVRVIDWARSPVPFRIPTTCGQQKTLDWIKPSHLESPSNSWGVIGRMALEILLFRSLFRNSRAELSHDERNLIVFGPTKWLWFFGLVFHWTFLVILLRHFRFFAEPVPAFVVVLQDLDGFFRIGVPVVYATSFLFLGAVSLLFLRRVLIPQLRYISLLGDYFPLFLLLGIGTTGVLLRHVYKTDIAAVKEVAMGLVSFNPSVPAGLHPLFFGHLFLVSVLFFYFPFSKLMHMGGVFLSPTRNLANNNRMKRHINPWDYPVEVHTYQEYEEEFRDKMIAAEIPVETESHG